MNSRLLNYFNGLIARGDGIKPLSGRRIKLGACALAVFALLLAALALTRGGKQGDAPLDLLSGLPPAGEDAPRILIAALEGEFPQYAARLLADSATISPEGASPVTAMLPIFDSSEAVALVVTERVGGLAMYGAFILSDGDVAALGSGRLPAGWKRCFVLPELRQAGAEGRFQIRANNMTSTLYLEVRGDRAYIADSLRDIERIGEVRAGRAGGVKQEWAIKNKWGGRMFLSDGGVLRSMISDDGDERAEAGATEIEVAWNSAGDAPSGEAEWRLSGAGDIMGGMFFRGIKGRNWSSDDIFLPDPLIMALGINLPDPGRSLSSAAGPMAYLADHLRKMGLKNSDIRAVLTGPATISLGGRTQLLWFELPGIMLDIPGRGGAAHRLIEKFWSELFLGADPKPVDGYDYGGMTDLPFSILAAGNDKKAIIGLSSSDAERNEELPDLLRGAKNSLAWFYVDIPKLGVSLSELPAINSILYEYEEGPDDEESADILKETMSKLGKLFVTLDSPGSGRAMWYY